MLISVVFTLRNTQVLIEGLAQLGLIVDLTQLALIAVSIHSIADLVTEVLVIEALSASKAQGLLDLALAAGNLGPVILASDNQGFVPDSSAAIGLELVVEVTN